MPRHWFQCKIHYYTQSFQCNVEKFKKWLTQVIFYFNFFGTVKIDFVYNKKYIIMIFILVVLIITFLLTAEESYLVEYEKFVYLEFSRSTYLPH